MTDGSSQRQTMRVFYSLLILVLAGSCSGPVPAPTPTLQDIASGGLEIVDLTYPLSADNPHWPAENYRPFSFETLATLEEDGVFSGAFYTPEHLGTHLDAPNHFETGQPSVDELQLPHLVRPMTVIDIRDSAQRNPDYMLSTEDIQLWEEEHGLIPEGAVVFAYTGWGSRWTDYASYKNQDEQGQMHFPGFSPEAAEFLVDQRSILGLGIDTLSVDVGLSKEFEVHHKVHSRGGYHIENAANLNQVPPTGSWVLIAPIKLKGGSGGPARVWAVFEGTRPGN